MTQQTLDGDIGAIKGIITSIISRDGETNNNKWTRYAIIIGGSEYSGFKGSVKGIENLKEDEEVHIVYKLNGPYKNIIEINPGEIKEAIELLSQETKDKLKSVEMMIKKTNRNASEWTDEETKECLNNSSSVQDTSQNLKKQSILSEQDKKDSSIPLQKDFNNLNNKNNTQDNTPFTNPKGETKIGKVNKHFTEGRLIENTKGLETRRGSSSHGGTKK